MTSSALARHTGQVVILSCSSTPKKDADADADDDVDDDDDGDVDADDADWGVFSSSLSQNGYGNNK